jgi:tRNA G18 (ribose-2'-O)-methylase SpoU
LEEYLQRVKEDGYSVIGIEQSNNSVPLQEFKFPEKSVLVLGKEREGVPVDIMQLLDSVIEIPQFGIIRYALVWIDCTRSLNVHVSASVVIWEYVKQHIKET